MKKQFLLINLGLILASSSFASLPFFPKHLQNKPHVTAHIKKLSQTPNSYANFSGNWKGTCDEDPEEEISLLIEQSEDFSSITVNNMEMQMDGILAYHFNGNFEAQNNIVHLRWSNDGQQILGSIMNYQKEGNMSQGNMQMVVGKVNWVIENQKLHTDTIASVFLDGTLIDTVSSHCVLSQVNRLD